MTDKVKAAISVAFGPVVAMVAMATPDVEKENEEKQPSQWDDEEQKRESRRT